jgi:hypothetical protein
MSHSNDRDAGDVERLLAGRAPSGDGELAALADFVSGLKAAYPEEPVPVLVEAGHLAAMVAAAQLDLEGGDLAPRRAGTSHGRVLYRPRFFPWRGTRAGARPSAARLTAKLGLASIAFLLIFSGLALAGALPGPVQGFASRAAAALGIDMASHSDDQGSLPPVAGSASPSSAASSTAAPWTTAKPSTTAQPGAADKPGSSGEQDRAGTNSETGSQRSPDEDEGDEEQPQAQGDGGEQAEPQTEREDEGDEEQPTQVQDEPQPGD